MHVCLSGRPNQLLRWQEAFPHGRIIRNLRDLDRHLTGSDIVWLHLDSLDERDLASTTASILAKPQQIHLITITTIPEPKKALACLQLGISGYCHALSTPASFQKVATVVESGGYWLGEVLVQKLIKTLGQQIPTPEDSQVANILSPLSSREREVALQVRHGASNKEIAEALFITERTVKAHLGSIFRKLGLRDRLQLVILLTQENE